jgi:hypothetical protein
MVYSGVVAGRRLTLYSTASAIELPCCRDSTARGLIRQTLVFAAECVSAHIPRGQHDRRFHFRRRNHRHGADGADHRRRHDPGRLPDDPARPHRRVSGVEARAPWDPVRSHGTCVCGSGDGLYGVANARLHPPLRGWQDSRPYP